MSFSHVLTVTLNSYEDSVHYIVITFTTHTIIAYTTHS